MRTGPTFEDLKAAFALLRSRRRGRLLDRGLSKADRDNVYKTLAQQHLAGRGMIAEGNTFAWGVQLANNLTRILHRDQAFREAADRIIVAPEPLVLEPIGITGESTLSGALFHFVDALQTFIHLVDYRSLSSVPNEQRISPVYFEVRDERVGIAPSQLPSSSSESTMSHAAAALSARGEILLAELQRSNVDPRACGLLTELLRVLRAEANPILIGMTTQALKSLLPNIREEVAPTLFTAMLSFGQSAEDYALQFPAWSEFSQNAAAARMTSEDERRVVEAADALARELEGDREHVDPDVPRTVRFVQELTKDPKKKARESAFSLLRTLENFVITAVHNGTAFFGEAWQGARRPVRVGVSVALATVLLGWAGMVVDALTGVNITSQLTDLRWLHEIGPVLRSISSQPR